MKVGRPMAIIFGAFVLFIVSAAVRPVRVEAGSTSPNRLDATFARLRETQKRLGPKAILSGGARSLFHLANNWESMKAKSARAAVAKPLALMASTLTPGLISAPPNYGPTAVFPSRLRGFIANESSTAWCGNNVVVGFNDTESEVDSLFTNPNFAVSSLGYSVSTNKGGSFTDRGFLPVSSEPSVLGFDQVATCTSAKVFYISSLYNNLTQTAVSVSASSDGGQTFGPPLIAVAASNTGHFFDGDWMAVNPVNPKQLFITYTDDDFTNTTCPTALGTSIEMVNSNDGGNTWSSPVTVANEVCFDPASSNKGVVEFSGVAVDPRGTAVYVTWESFDAGSFAREADISSAAIPATSSPTPLSLSFGSPVKISSINYAGTFDGPTFGSANGASFVQLLQGRVISGEHPELAIGKGSKNKGVLYVTWNDGTNSIPDGHSANCCYQFTDILLTTSADGGNTWSAPVRVNNNVEDGTTHPFTDQFRPTIATDKTGAIGVCFYDRRNDPLNFLIGRYCAVSTDGKHWTNIAIDPEGGPSIVNQDDFTIPDWLGDYETLASDSLNQSAGFIGGYTDTSAGYQNIRRNRFSSDDQ
jgi:hypothetical protein